MSLELQNMHLTIQQKDRELKDAYRREEKTNKSSVKVKTQFDALFKEQQNDNNVIETSAEQEFQCTHPKSKGGHIVYQCKGVDNMGNWDGERRYSEFFKLHQVLSTRWPGVPIPTLPPKKAIGNKELKFLNERRFYLERFLKKMAPFEFILNSTEF